LAALRESLSEDEVDAIDKDAHVQAALACFGEYGLRRELGEE
jgi:hypothetical protein